jgi:adenosylhomocysteine nucleosidase
MEQECIGLVVAMPEERRPIIQKLGSHRKEKAGPFSVYLFQQTKRSICLIESGMGTKNAFAATEELISFAKPRSIITAGLGGAVRPGLAVGDVVIAEQSLALREGVLSSSATLDNSSFLPALAEAFQGRPFRIAVGSTVTSDIIMHKKTVAQLLAGDVMNPVLDMETSAMAEAAAHSGIPLIALRSISDADDEELLFSLNELTDRDLNIRLHKVLLTIAKKPRILPQMLRLAKNVKLAANNLATVLEQLVRMV